MIILIPLNIIVSTTAQETLEFGIKEGDSWTLQYEMISGPAENESAWVYSYANETITFLNFTNNVLYLNVSMFYTDVHGEETFTYNYTELFEYNLTDIAGFLNETVMRGYFPYILPINWALIQETLQELYQTVERNMTFEFNEIQRDNVNGKPVDVIVILIQENTTYTFTYDNITSTEVIRTYAEAKYGKKTGILLTGEFREEVEYYEDSEKIESYIYIQRFWIFNSTFTYWESEEIEEAELTPQTVATSASSAAAGIASAAVAVTVSSVSGVVAPTAATVPTSQVVSGAEEVRSKFSWKYLKYLWKLRKLKRKKKKEEIPPPKNTVPMTLALAIIGAITGVGVATMAFGFSVPLAILVTLVTVVTGFTLAEAGLSLFVRRYYFFRMLPIQWGKKEKLSLLIILATGLYGVMSALVSAILLIKVIAALAVFIVVPTAIVAYITVEELTIMQSAQ